MKIYIRDWLAGSAVALVLEERSRYSREWHAGSAVTVVLEERIREWLGGSPARQCMRQSVYKHGRLLLLDGGNE